MDSPKFLFAYLPTKQVSTLYVICCGHCLSLLSGKLNIYGWFNPCCFRYLPGCKKCYTDDELIYLTDAEESDNEGKIKGQTGWLCPICVAKTC